MAAAKAKEVLHMPRALYICIYRTLQRLASGLGDIVPLFAALQAACKGISMLVQRAAIAGATGVAAGGGENAGGDEQKKLDVVSNDLLKGFLARSGVVRVLASEEVGPRRCVLRNGCGIKKTQFKNTSSCLYCYGRQLRWLSRALHVITRAPRPSRPHLKGVPLPVLHCCEKSYY